jgi:hypothetical protein
LAVSDGFIGKIQELSTAATHLDGHVAQGCPAELQLGGLAVPGAAKIFHLAGRVLLKFFD